MRDAFGGTFMIKLAMIFIVIYISFMAITINYAKTFRVKNQIINIVEQYQYSGKGDKDTEDKIRAYLNSVPYNYSGNTQAIDNMKDKCQAIAGEDIEFTFIENGICIIPQGGSIGNFANSSRYYKVVSFINIDFNFFNIRMNLPISGETKVIYINENK